MTTKAIGALGAKLWNASYDVGAPVRCWPFQRGTIQDVHRDSVTTSPAQQLNNDAVVWIDGVAGPVLLSYVHPLAPAADSLMVRAAGLDPEYENTCQICKASPAPFYAYQKATDEWFPRCSRCADKAAQAFARAASAAADPKQNA